MKYYKELIDKKLFAFEDIVRITGNRGTAYSLIRSYLCKGYIKSIRRNLYTAISMETKQAVANKYEIGSRIADDAYISHHSAFEFYGMANQVFNELYVSTKCRFTDFEFEGVCYKSVYSKTDMGVVKPQHYSEVRVSDLERTVIDSIKDFDKIGGFEELLECLGMITFLDSDKLQKYLKEYNLQVLYQKTGYILELFKDSLKLNDGFFDFCESNIGKSVRYMSNEGADNQNKFINKWQLIVPEIYINIKEDGGNELV